MKMTWSLRVAAGVAGFGLAVNSLVWAGAPILQATDPILGIDIDPLSVVSSYPGGENPPKAVDLIGNVGGNKYLNFGRRNTGFIATPTAATTVHSLVLTTAGDAPDRDPVQYAVYGTNDPITSADNSDGSAENWTLISGGTLAPPTDRNMPAPTVSFANSSAFNSYRVIFPEIRNFRATNSMQVAELGLFESTDGSGTSVFSTLSPGSSVLAVQLPISLSRSPGAEGPENVLDGNPATKYLNFSKENAGFIVTPSAGPSVVGSFQITTANDAPGRDPASWALYGTNDPITSANFSQGSAENWTLIDSGALALPGDPAVNNDQRGVLGPLVPVNNTTAYASYRMVFPTLKDTMRAGVDSLQFADIQFYAVPEPAGLALGLMGLAAGAAARGRRNRS
jgi:hypothetical protein